MENIVFKRASRSLSKLRLAISGISGSGKTYSALLLAKGMGGKIAVIDTERGSASLYADLPGMPEFDVLDLDAPYTPERYIEAIHAAEKAGYDIVIIDSMTHEWTGSGGCLELVDSIARAKFRGNTWSAWSELTPRHRAFIDAMLQSRCHVIATMRSKTDTVQTENDRGKKVVQKVGLKAEQRDGLEYEFTVVFDLSQDHVAAASKDRTAMFSDPLTLTEDTGRRIAEWLSSAKPEPQAAAPAPAAQPQPQPQAAAPEPDPAPVAEPDPAPAAAPSRDELIYRAAADAAALGLESYQAFFMKIPKADKKWLNDSGHHQELKRLAAAADDFNAQHAAA